MRTTLISLLLCSVIVLNAQSGWIQRTSLPANGRHRATGCSIGNKGYMGLGHVNGNSGTINYADWWEYDPASDSWTQKANYPSQNYGAVCFVAAGKAHVGGGAFFTGEFYAYSPLNNSWTAIPNCPVAPGDQGAMSINDKGYVVAANLLYEFDPLTNQWTQKANSPTTFSNWCIAFSIGASGYVKNAAGLYEYKPLNNQWVVRAAFPGSNTNGGAAMIHNNKAYVVSGYVGSLSFVTDEVWEYNPGSNVWTRMVDFPGSARRFSVAFTINNRGYFGTGTHGINLNDFWEMLTPVGMEEYAAELSMRVFPNPAQDYVTFELTESAEFEKHILRVTDLSGKLVHEESFVNGRIVMDRNNLQTGVYLYSVSDENGFVSNGKFIFN